MRTLLARLLRGTIIAAAAALVAVPANAQRPLPASPTPSAIANVTYFLPARQMRVTIPESRDDSALLRIETPSDTRLSFRNGPFESGFVIYPRSNLSSSRWQTFNGIGSRDSVLPGVTARFPFGPDSGR